MNGEWSGTMNLAEVQAGSDLTAVRCMTVPVDDHHLVTGQKIFISWGDHDFVDNIVHLMLARTESYMRIVQSRDEATMALTIDQF
ncbi:MAG: hypothetical protein KUG71_05850 [Porticoccaceae bacterium]|nr:hypothetical protein [Porticoccaceae bacterium]